MEAAAVLVIAGVMVVGCMFAVNAYRRDIQRTIWHLADMRQEQARVLRHSYALEVVAVLREHTGRQLVHDHDEIHAILAEADDRFERRVQAAVN